MSTQASPNVAQTTIYYVQTITALMTATATQTSVVTFCPSAFSSYVPSAYPGLGGSGGTVISPGSSGTGSDGSQSGPCPGQGYTCSNCLDGWFCPPSQTPAAQVPCGYGWPCYHCEGGFFCIPAQTVAQPVPAHAHSALPTQAAAPTNPSTANGYQYVGCYQDNPDRSLRDAQLLNLAGGMTNDQCVGFCQTRGFAIAGTEDGTQCFCGTLLLDSANLDEGQCNVSCSGNLANLTMCGGPWALSIWTIDGSLQQAQADSAVQLSTPVAMPGSQDAFAVVSRFDAATAAYVWSSPESPVNTGAASLISMNTSNLESAMLAAVAAQARGLAPIEPASARGIIKSVSMILNMGMSSIASELSRAVPTGNTTSISGVTNILVAPRPAIPSITLPISGTASPVTAVAGIPTTRMAGSNPNGGDGLEDVSPEATEGSYDFPSLTLSARAGKGLRHRAGLF